MAVESATLSARNSRLTVVFDADTTNGIVLSGPDSGGVTATIVSGSGESTHVYSIPEGQVVGNNISVNEVGDSTLVRVAGFNLLTDELPINNDLVVFENFPLSLQTDKDLVNITTSRDAIYSSHAKKWSLPSFTLSSEDSVQKRYITHELSRGIYSDYTFNVTLPLEFSTFTGTNTAAVTATGTLTSGANSITMAAVSGDIEDAVYPGLLFNFSGLQGLFMVTSVESDGTVRFTPPARETLAVSGLPIVTEDPQITVRVTSNDVTYNIPANVDYYCSITLDMEEVV